MKLSKNITELILELEYLIGSKCYNTSSFNGYTLEEGCHFRYPVWVKSNKYGDRSYKGHLLLALKNEDISIDAIKGMRYKFGANHLYPGEALIEILERLEKKFGIDFNELIDQAKRDNSK